MNRRLGIVSLLSFALLACSGGGEDDGNTAADANNDGFPDGDLVAADADVPQPDAPPFNLPDASPAALGCAGDPLPTTIISPPVVISGTVQEAGLSGVSTMTQSAHVEARLQGDDSLFEQGDFTGPFSLTDPDNSTAPISAYLKSTSNGYVDTYVYPPYAISESQSNTPIIMVSDAIFGLLSIVVGVQHDAGNGVLIVAVTDCNQSNIEGATINITPNVGTIKYAGADGIPGMTDYPSTQASGVAYIFNVPPGDYTIGASVGSVDLRDNAVKSYADANTTLIVAP